MTTLLIINAVFAVALVAILAYVMTRPAALSRLVSEASSPHRAHVRPARDPGRERAPAAHRGVPQRV